MTEAQPKPNLGVLTRKLFTAGKKTAKA